EAAEWKDRSNQETWRRARLFEMLLEQSQREWSRTVEEHKRLHEEERDRWQEERDRVQKDREQERARLNGELDHLRSTLSWRITAPLRRLPQMRPAAPAPPPASPPAPIDAAAPLPAPPPAPTARVHPKAWRQLDLMEDALRHLHEKGLRPRIVLDVGAARGAWSQ